MMRLLLALCLTLPAFGQMHRYIGVQASVQYDYWVDTTSGDDTTGNGLTRATAWKTLNKAVASATAGKTVAVVAGTYTEDHVTKHNWYATKQLHWRSVGGDVIVRANAAGASVLEAAAGANGSTWRGQFVFDGQSVQGTGIKLTTTDALTFAGCTIRDATAMLLNPTATTNLAVRGCTFSGAPNSGAIYGVYGGTISGNTFNLLAGTWGVLYTQAANTAAVTFSGNVITNAGTTYVVRLDGAGDVTISGNTFSLTGATVTALVYVSAAGKTGALTFSGNTVTAIKTTSAAFVASASARTIAVRNNTISVTDATQAQPIIGITDHAAPVIDGNTIETWAVASHIKIASTGTAVGAAEITNNTLRSRGATGYVIEVGSENTSAGDNQIDGAVIRGNTIYSALYYNPEAAGTSAHAVFVGWNRNAVIEQNTVYGGPYGIVVKHGGTAYTAGGIRHNLLVDCYGVQALRVKGVRDLTVYHNTVVFARDAGYGLYITQNAAGQTATGVIVKNNIFYGFGEQGIVVENDGSDVGFQSDYNLIQSANMLRIGTIGAASYADWAAWQAAYDAHGLGVAPQLGSDYRPLTGSPVIGAGVSIPGVNTPPANIGRW